MIEFLLLLFRGALLLGMVAFVVAFFFLVLHSLVYLAMWLGFWVIPLGLTYILCVFAVYITDKYRGI